jgi:hypothetical protein
MLPRLALVTLLAVGGFSQSVSNVRKSFETPPDDARIMMRWWWFGSAVSKPELERELRTMKEGGIGGVEVQPVYPLVLDDPEAGVRNLPYLSDEFIDALRFASQKARELGLRMDITLGSGWPYGGPHVPITEAAGRLRCDRVNVPADSTSIALPSLENGEKLIAAFLARGDGRTFAPDGLQRLDQIDDGRVQLPRKRAGQHTVLFFISSRTGQQVKRPAVNAEGYVLDHYDRGAIEHHLKIAGDRLMQAFGENPPYAVFSDSLEVYGSDWTPDLLEQFQKRRGYDLIPLLPALVGDIGKETEDVRCDWGKTLTELAEERYLTPIREWAQRHGTRFRSQSYGIPPVILSSNALVDLPEGEGSQWRGFSATRWASSASHLYGRPVTSSETWTWLHSPVFRATPLDMKAEADLHFLQGINQLVGHGWPYSPPSAGEPGWRFYAAAVFNNHNPWWIAMPDIAKYLQRISYVLRQGKPANDVALYLPTEDAWAQFTVGKDSVNQAMAALLGPDLIPKILDAGFNFDFIDDRAIEKIGIPYPVLVLPAFKRMPKATIQKLEEFRKRGGIVVDAAHIGDLARRYTPDFATGDPAIGFIHRKLEDREVYFVVNTGNQPVNTTAHVRLQNRDGNWQCYWLDPLTGTSTAAPGGDQVNLNFAPYESRVLVIFRLDGFFDSNTPKRPEETFDISSDWKVEFPALKRTVDMHQLRSWTDDDAMKLFSGQAVYEKIVSIPGSMTETHRKVLLNFGEGTPVPPAGRPGPGMRAWLESPVHEAAVVYVNNQRAGAVWAPPYEIDVTNFVKFGSNTIRIEVGNLAINELAGQSLPDYKLLNLRYGARFQAQDMENLRPLPSGLLGPIRLIAR